jgi:hypothetical protein
MISNRKGEMVPDTYRLNAATIASDKVAKAAALADKAKLKSEAKVAESVLNMIEKKWNLPPSDSDDRNNEREPEPPAARRTVSFDTIRANILRSFNK